MLFLVGNKQGGIILAMVAAKEYAARSVTEFKTLMTGVNRVNRLVAHAEQNPDKIARIYYGYYSIIKDMINLSEDDSEIIEGANIRLQKENKFAKFKEIIAGREDEFMGIVARACDPENKSYELGVKKLTEMMKKADRIKTKNPDAKADDKDHMWDNVIWGYTNGADDPETDEHFCITHGLTQIINRSFFKKLNTEGNLFKKDWFICAMTEVLILKGLRGEGWESEFYQQWRDTRPKGLSWVSDSRLAAYKAELNEQKAV